MFLIVSVAIRNPPNTEWFHNGTILVTDTLRVKLWTAKGVVVSGEAGSSEG
jgi:hypothetical protein